jgi:hypothetical protein
MTLPKFDKPEHYDHQHLVLGHADRGGDFGEVGPSLCIGVAPEDNLSYQLAKDVIRLLTIQNRAWDSEGILSTASPHTTIELLSTQGDHHHFV